MRRTLVSLAAVALTLGIATASQAQNYQRGYDRTYDRGYDRTYDPNARMGYQGSRFGNSFTSAEERIRQGQESGELTPREVAMLERQLRHIQHMRWRARMNGWTDEDRTQIRFAQSELNQRIWQLKHNNWRVNPY